jgi:hypothetical protein
MTDTPKEVVLYVVWNEDGSVEADTDHDVAVERLNDNFGGNIRREMKFTLSIPLPKPIEATVTLHEAADAVTVIVAG